MASPESDIRKKLIEYCKAKNHFVFPVANRPQGKRANTRFKGIPDLLGISANGKALAIEIKSENDRQRPEQKDFEENFKRRGGIYLIAGCVNDLIENNL
jgi:hypothetical protein